MLKTFLTLFKESSHSFEGQEDGEEVILLLRRHPFYIMMKLSTFALAALVPIVIGVVFFNKLVSNGLLTTYMALAGMWQLVVWFSVFYTLTMYTLNVVIVTNHRLIDSEQLGLFDRKISELHMERVQDISVETKGIIETALRIGDIVVQTAGSERHFIFEQIPDPETMKDAIMKIASKKSNSSVVV